MSTSQALQRLYSLDTSSPDILRLLYGLIRHDKEEQYLTTLQGSELIRLVDFLDEALSAIPATDDVSRQCLHKLQAICGHHMTLPSSYTVSSELARVGDCPIAFGGFADVWEGTHSGRKVCLKQLRVPLNNDKSLMKSFLKEVVIWKRLRHPNVVPFIGVTRNPLQIVSEWMPNGILTKYVETNPGANRIGLLLDVAEGLNYLHTNHTIHGDLKGPNILVDHNGRARLTDFGLASIPRGMTSVLITQPQGYSPGWAAPEILEGTDRITREADIFAFGMVVIEAFTGRYPFGDLSPMPIVLRVLGGKRPARPREAQDLGLVDSVWDMTASCWQQDPVHRPTIAGVVRFLRECYILHAANLSLSTLAPWQPAANVDDATDGVPIPPMPTNGNATLAQSPGTSPHSGQPNDQSHEISLDPSPAFNMPHPDVSQRSGSPAREPLSDEPRVLSNSSPEKSELEVAEMRINEIAKELAHENPGSEGGRFAELLELCGHHHIIPMSYRLEGVVAEGDRPQRKTSELIEVWKGRYNGEVVALKVPRVPREDSHINIQRKLCREVVWMKHLEHDNIVPFYGASTAIAAFCTVFPWYENGNIMDFLERKSDVNRFDLLLDAARGVCFIHQNGAWHGALRASYILIDDNGAARLDLQSEGDIHNYRYSAPETQWPRLYGSEKGDVYGMGMIVYEVLSGNMPYSECDDSVVLSNIQAGKIPTRPSDGITDSVWELLEQCWRRDTTKRASAPQIYDFFSKLCSLPPEIEELPRKLKLRVRSVSFAPNTMSAWRAYLRLTYGDKFHETSLSSGGVPGADYTCNAPQTWLIETDRQRHEQSVWVEVYSLLSRYGIGKFSLLNSVNKQIDVDLETDAKNPLGVLEISIMEAS